MGIYNEIIGEIFLQTANGIGHLSLVAYNLTSFQDKIECKAS